jgi:serine/threonine-protein kinase
MTQQVRGTTFGKYTLIDRIAVGGMAEIFLAKQAGVEGFEKLLALKRIRPHLSGHDNFVTMFLNEAKLAAQLTHPSVVQIYDLGRIGESFFIAMEYVPGRDMSRVMPKCKQLGIPFPLEYAMRIASSALEALYYAHNKTDPLGNPLHIVHRDVTPENILVGWSGSVKIADFGIAKATSQLGGANETRAGEIKGKLSYMSPEQCMGKDMDHRSDIFSLGVVLYEWLTGFRLFSGDNDMAIMNNIIEGKIYPPSYFKGTIPEVAETILMKALEKDRKKRYQSAWDMQFDIDTFLAESEFTPSNVHLSNFMKQIFAQEIAAEQKSLKAYETEHRSEVIELGVDALILDERPLEERTMAMHISPSGSYLTLSLNEQETLALRQAADEKNVSREALALALLREFLGLGK